jgi:hypothetical protein
MATCLGIKSKQVYSGPFPMGNEDETPSLERRTLDINLEADYNTARVTPIFTTRKCCYAFTEELA